MPTLYDNFERVRQYIDQHQGGGGDMSAYVTKDELSAQSYLTSIPSEYITDAELSAQSYLTSIPSTYASYNGVYAYLYDTLGISHGGSQGVSYIEDAELHNAELSGVTLINGISTDELPTYAAISAMGYLTSIPSEYVTDTELSSALGNYYTDGEVDAEISSALSFYYTKTEINNASYVTSSDLPVINENIIPKETGTYTLGDTSNYYDYIYANRLNFPSTGGWLRTGTNPRVFVSTTALRPFDSTLGLGTSSTKWGATYTTDLYADNIHNFIWTGTSAEYAALSDYTTYQIYMIKEA